MLDLNKLLLPQARDRGFFHLQYSEPRYKTRSLMLFGREVFRVTYWTRLWNAKYEPVTFFSMWLFNRLQFYIGGAKIDGTRTIWYREGKLDDGYILHYVPDIDAFVVTTHPKELLALRWRRNGANTINWDVMGGS